MIQLKDIFQHPATLLAMVMLGAWVGILFPGSAAYLGAGATLYLGLIQMAALPFVVLAVFFGLQRMVSLQDAARRVRQLVLMSVLAMLACTVVGVLVATLTSAGSGLSTAQIATLGESAMQSESQFAMAMYGGEAAESGLWDFSSLLRDNLYGVLAYGSLPAVLIGAVFFGCGLASQQGEAAGHLNDIFEGIYRALESLIHRFNNFLPAAAFVMAAAATSAAGAGSIGLLASFLGAFFLAAAVVCGVAIAIIAWRLKKSPWEVLAALREPITICLFSPVAVAAVPGFIQAMSVQLGFSRGLVELVTPIAPVFIKAGEALFFAVLAIFIANLYGHNLDAGEVAMICAMSWLAAFLSLGIVGGKSIILGTFVMSSMGLPLEAVLPVFMLVEVLCEGMRHLLAFLVSSALIALVSDGLYIDTQQVTDNWRPGNLHLSFTRRQAMAGIFLVAIALMLVFSAGVGFGLRKAIFPDG